METTNVEDIVSKWEKHYADGTLTNRTIREYWKIKVPEIYSPQPTSNTLRATYEEEVAKKVLFDPLERFMCGGEPSETYQLVKQLDNPPPLCGRVFKNGDPTYGCRDCGMDPTCVVCADCFKNSAHSKHRYKISTSSGGGYCDCGDREAWKNDVFCNIHIKREMEDHDQSDVPKIPQDLVGRIQIVFDLILQYAKELLTHNNSFHLPSDLEIKESDESPSNMSSLVKTYTTMLFNDETHTYDQVITTLERAIGCSKRDAVAYATCIDREGRCIVRCSSYSNCMLAKQYMEKPISRGSDKPLNVQVVLSHIIAHQVFAGKLLNWLHEILESAHSFRLVFSEIVSRDNCSLIESIFRADTQMWKAARIQWHKLFISGMLLDLKSKKAFARVFTKHYHKMMGDFIHDDHEHSVCIISLTVQLFTMPTIAYTLIKEEDVLARLMNTFLSECNGKLRDGKLALEHRNSNTSPFRRIQYILFDLKYLLGIRPDEWSNDIRKGFLHGFSLILKLLSMMQGMDPVVRQVGKHLEFEPEWESAFNLHIKLASVIPLVIDWCSSDMTVLKKAYRILLTELAGQCTDEMRKRRYTRDLLDYSVSCLEYDVSSAPVSIHLPLSRLLAGLTLPLQKYNLNFNSSEFSISNKPSPEELMEPVLRTKVLIAQFNAGMWKRNGFYLSNQIFFYHNVRCRQEMLDRDIMLLQVCANYIDANEFIIHILNKFNLLKWARGPRIESGKDMDGTPSYEETSHTNIVLAEEFLHLLIILVAERYTPGIGQVTDEERVKKEIIQLLCMEAMPHSLLNKALPEGTNHETGMEKVIDQVADFKKPSPTAKGVFELKNEFYNDYNLFYYHYSKEEQSKAEVTQRARRKAAGQEEFCPPPKLPPFTESFMLLNNLLQCDVFLHIVSVVLERFADKKNDNVSELQLQMVLYLIGFALHEEERFKKNKDPYFHFTAKARNVNILGLMENLVGNPRTSTHKHLLNWTINRYHELLELGKETGTKMKVPKVVPSSSASSSASNAEKKRRAAQRAAMIMNRMANMQQNFIENNETLFKETSSDQDPAADSSENTMMDYCEETPPEFVATGPKQSMMPVHEPVYTCILCHQDDIVGIVSGKPPGRSMVYGALVQRSTVLSKNRSKTLKNPAHQDTNVLPLDLHWGVYTSSCGHPMHAGCWQRYFDDVAAKERRRPARFRQNLSTDIDKYEYLCPLCESLCNTAMPLLPTISSPSYISLKAGIGDKPTITMSNWLEGIYCIQQKRTTTLIEAAGENSKSQADKSSNKPHLWTGPNLQTVKDRLSEINPEVASAFADLFGKNYEAPDYPAEAQDMLVAFAHAVYMHGLGVQACFQDPRIPQMVFCSTAYTIKVLEQVQRDNEKSLLDNSLLSRTKDWIKGLVKFAAYSPLATDIKYVQHIVMKTLGNIVDISKINQCILEWDAFSSLISLTLGLPAFFEEHQCIAKGSIQDQYLIKIFFLAHLVQILLTYEGQESSESIPDPESISHIDATLELFTQSRAQSSAHRPILSNIVPLLLSYEGSSKDTVNSPDSVPQPTRFIAEDCKAAQQETEQTEDDPMEVDSQQSDAEWILKLINQCRFLAQFPAVTVDAEELLDYVKNASLPFLRCCSIFYHFLTEVPLPDDICNNEFYNCLKYLGIGPQLVDCFNEGCFANLLMIWCFHPKILNSWKSARDTQTFKWTDLNKLVDLPDDYSELMNTESQFPCPSSSGDDSRSPTMCLVCRQMLCSQSYCCQTEFPEGSENMVGACTYHAHFCSAGSGIFLRIRECRVLLLSGKIKGCYAPPPYLDEYGETDQCLKRGNPLHLDVRQYKKLHDMWLNHQIPDIIAHSMECSNSLLNTEWHHL